MILTVPAFKIVTIDPLVPVHVAIVGSELVNTTGLPDEPPVALKIKLGSP